MRTLFLNTFDTHGGASRAAYRLHVGLIKAGVESHMLVQSKDSDDETVTGRNSKCGRMIDRIGTHLESLPLRCYPRRRISFFSSGVMPTRIRNRVTSLAPDVVHLHWINSGFVGVRELTRLRKPMIWTLHDMWPFTGGCHYSENCDRFTGSCGSCPQLGSVCDFDITRLVWRRKRSSWNGLPLTIVCPSNWLAKKAASSSLFNDRDISVIPNGIDVNVYKPVQRQTARAILNLPQDRKYVLFGAVDAENDRRKGFHLLEQALRRLARTQLVSSLELLVFGSSRSSKSPDFGLPTRYLGRLQDDATLSLIYSAANVFAAPSVQDNLANTVMEAMACGTPCVAFDIGGMPDMIDHRENGCLARPYEADDLANEIVWVLENSDRNNLLALRAREKATKVYALDKVASRYITLYDKILR